VKSIKVKVPFARWGMNLIGPIAPPYSAGHIFFLTATDYFTKLTYNGSAFIFKCYASPRCHLRLAIAEAEDELQPLQRRFTWIGELDGSLATGLAQSTKGRQKREKVGGFRA